MLPLRCFKWTRFVFGTLLRSVLVRISFAASHALSLDGCFNNLRVLGMRRFNDTPVSLKFMHDSSAKVWAHVCHLFDTPTPVRSRSVLSLFQLLWFSATVHRTRSLLVRFWVVLSRRHVWLPDFCFSTNMHCFKLSTSHKLMRLSVDIRAVKKKMHVHTGNLTEENVRHVVSLRPFGMSHVNFKFVWTWTTNPLSSIGDFGWSDNDCKGFCCSMIELVFQNFLTIFCNALDHCWVVLVTEPCVAHVAKIEIVDCEKCLALFCSCAHERSVLQMSSICALRPRAPIFAEMQQWNAEAAKSETFCDSSVCCERLLNLGWASFLKWDEGIF